MTNSFHELSFDSILPNLSTDSYKQVLKSLSKHVSNMVGTSEKLLFDELIKHEKIQSSAIGYGVAIADIRLPRLTKPMNIFMRTPQGVNFQAHDGSPVDMVCLVLSPEFEGTRHLSRLAKITRCFKNEEFVDKLRDSTNAENMRYAIKEMQNRKIAA